MGVDLPRDKRMEIALTYIYGIGRATRHYFGKPPKDLTPREALEALYRLKGLA